MHVCAKYAGTVGPAIFCVLLQAKEKYKRVLVFTYIII